MNLEQSGCQHRYVLEPYAIARLREVYCSTTGYDYAHVFVPEERECLRQAAESGR